MLVFIPKDKIDTALMSSEEGGALGIEYICSPTLSSQLGKLLIGVVTCHDEPIRSPDYDNPECFGIDPKETIIDIATTIMANAIIELTQTLHGAGTISQVWCESHGIQLDIYYSERPVDD